MCNHRHGHIAQLAKTSVSYVKFERPSANRDNHFAILCTEYVKVVITIRLRYVKFFFPYGPRTFVLTNECTVVGARREGRRVCVALDVQP